MNSSFTLINSIDYYPLIGEIYEPNQSSSNSERDTDQEKQKMPTEQKKRR